MNVIYFMKYINVEFFFFKGPTKEVRCAIASKGHTRLCFSVMPETQQIFPLAEFLLVAEFLFLDES